MQTTIQESEIPGYSLSTVVKAFSFLIPIIGITLYFVHRKKNPKAAKQGLIFGLTGLVLSFLTILIAGSQLGIPGSLF